MASDTDIRRARQMRSDGVSVTQIAQRLGVSDSTIYNWLDGATSTVGQNESPVEDAGPIELTKKQQFNAWFREGQMLAQSDVNFRLACALYWGEGRTGDRKDYKISELSLASSDPDLVRLWCSWLGKQQTEHDIRIRVHMDANNTMGDANALAFWKRQVGIHIRNPMMSVDRVGDLTGKSHSSEGTAYVVVYDPYLRALVMGGIETLANRS